VGERDIHKKVLELPIPSFDAWRTHFESISEVREAGCNGVVVNGPFIDLGLIVGVRETALQSVERDASWRARCGLLISE
jgi:hypothetical protein